MAELEVRLRVPTPGLLALPWSEPLADWDPTAVAIRDIPVGPSRHLVRFVEADGTLWALKAISRYTGTREYEMLRELEDRSLTAVRAAGLVVQPTDDDAILVTRYLARSWQFRRLLMRIAPTMTAHRARLFDAMAILLVELHRNGIYWGDCSLANTLFMRDGQCLQAWLVDAETAECHPALSDGQRLMDLDILVENVAGGLLDVAARRGEVPDAQALFEEARSIPGRYERLWDLLHDEPLVRLGDHDEIDERIHQLNDAGFALDEVTFSAERDSGKVRMKVAVAGRSFHSEQFEDLTGLNVGEGQARILLNDLRGHQARMQQDSGEEVPESVAARHWKTEVFRPGVKLAHRTLGHRGDPVQAYCDLLEVRWLQSEEAGYDVGSEPALDALATGGTPHESAATLSIVDLPTEEVPAVDPATVDPAPDGPSAAG